MTVVGDPSIWADRFRSVDIRLLQRIAAVWPKCVAVLPHQPDEDTITINLVDILSKDAQARRLFHYIEFHYEPFGYTPNGTAYSKGEIDLVVILDEQRDRYLAYECKRLSIYYNGTKHSLATPYVKEGLMRFVTEQYAENLPVGCMLGYVIDGDVPYARSKVYAAIDANKLELNLLASPSVEDSVHIIERFSTRHLRITRSLQIEVRHALLPF